MEFLVVKRLAVSVMRGKFASLLRSWASNWQQLFFVFACVHDEVTA